MKMRREMSEDRFYTVCCLRDMQCEGRIEWHHVFIYAGKQINEIWAIVSACSFHHRNVAEFKFKFEIVALSRATEEDLKKYPRVDWDQIKKKAVYLNLKVQLSGI